MKDLHALTLGGVHFDPRHPRRLWDSAALSSREREILLLIADGRTTAAIATELEVGEEAVTTLVRRTFAKLGAGRRAEAVAEAKRLGLI